MPDRSRVLLGRSVSSVLEQLLPVRCPSCRSPASGLCGQCRVRCRPAPALPLPVGLHACVAAHAYAGPARRAVLRAKAASAHALYRSMAIDVAHAARTQPIASVSPTLVTWPPTTSARRRRRGYDAAELLARATAERLGLPCAPMLVRHGGAQTERSARERAAVRFEAVRRVPSGARVLLVDDVRTTGATLTAAARALHHGGAAAVVAVTYAATPVPARRRPAPTARRTGA